MRRRSGAAAVGAAAYGAYGAYNNCYDAYGNWICPGQYPNFERAKRMLTAVGPVLTAVEWMHGSVSKSGLIYIKAFERFSISLALGSFVVFGCVN